MKYQDFSSDENLVSSEDTIFIFHTVKISLPDFLDQLFTHFKGQWRIVLIKVYMPYCYNIQNTDKRYLFSLFLD